MTDIAISRCYSLLLLLLYTCFRILFYFMHVVRILGLVSAIQRKDVMLWWLDVSLFRYCQGQAGPTRFHYLISTASRRLEIDRPLLIPTADRYCR